MIANGSSVNDVPSSENSTSLFAPSSADIWLNSLWFFSLTLSLLTAFLGVLAKQWLYQYMAVTSGDARSRALVRQARYVGLHDWQVPELIGVLPVVLHLSLALFFAGLVILLRSILQNLAIFIAAVVGTVYVAYVVSNILPIIYPRCPYRTALTPKLFKLIVWLYALRSVRLSFSPPSESPAQSPKEESDIVEKPWLGRWWSKLLTLRISASKFPLKRALWREAERKDALNTNGVLEAKAVAWLYTSSYNPTAKRVVLEGLAGSPTGYGDQYAKCWKPDVMSLVEEDLHRGCRRLDSTGPGVEIDRQQELYVRALSNIQPTPRDDFRYYLVNIPGSPWLRAVSSAYVEYGFFCCTPDVTSANFNSRRSWYSLGYLMDTEDMAKLRLTTSVWLSLFRPKPNYFHFKSTVTILTVLRDVSFFGSDSPRFSDSSLPSVDIYHPNKEMCNATHALISKQSLAAFKHLDDDSCDELPDTLLRLLSLIATNTVYMRGGILDGLMDRPLDTKVSTEDRLEALDVTLDCLMQIVANEQAHGRATTWSNLQKDVLAMLTTTPLFKIDETELKDIQPSVKRRVVLKTMSLIGLVYKPADPMPTTTIPFRSAMMTLLLRVYVNGPDAKGQPQHEYDDSIALLFSALARGDDFAYEAFRTENVIQTVCNDFLQYRLYHRGDLAFKEWNPDYPKHSYGGAIQGALSSDQFLDHYLAHIPNKQEHASGSPTKISSSDIERDKEYLFQPETLYCLCSTLLLWRDDRHRMLIRLLKLKPDAESWVDCIQRLIKLPQSESKHVRRRSVWDDTEEEQTEQLYRDIADIQSILRIDNERLEDPTWKQTVNFDTLETSEDCIPVCHLHLHIPLQMLMLDIQAS